jgi:predicted metal-dependent peptidase
LPLPSGINADKHAQSVEDAARQGRMVVEKMAGRGRGGAALDGVVQERQTNWRDAMREFVASVIDGDEQSRMCPPNKRLQPLGFLMPSHFSETTGELVIACDTSGSMGAVYPVVFGEVARIVQTCTPESVRLLWWDTEVCGEQVFKPHEYASIARALKPAGGGGTSPGAVVTYMEKHHITPKAVVWLTDGYLDGSVRDPGCPQLWGIVDNERFMPPKGKVVRISSARL